MKKKSRVYLAASGAALLLSMLCILISWLSLPEQYTVQLPEDGVSVLEELAFDCGDCVMESDGSVHVTGKDPQIYLDGIRGEINTLCIRFTQPLQPATTYKLYYTLPGTALSEEQSLSGRAVNGQTELVFHLDGGSYEQLRLDVDGDFVLADVLVSQSDPVLLRVDRLARLLSGDFSDLHSRQILLTVLILWAEAMLIAWQRRRLRRWAEEKLALYREHRRSFWFGVLRFAAGIAAGVAAWGLLCLAGVLTPSFYTAAYFVLAGCALGAAAALWRQTREHPERLLTALILCAGLTFALLLPRTAMVSWDDETHYRRALDLSFGGETWLTGADELIYPTLLSNEVSLDNARATEAMLNGLYEAGTRGSVVSELSSISTMAYLPSAAAIWLARAVGLPFTAIFAAGRIGNLLCYAVVFYFAMKRLRGSGLLMGLFALIPTMLFIAANYSYDGWCLAFLALGTAIFLDEYRHPERPLTAGTMAAMLGSLLLGCTPKAIYFPIFLMCLFLPREKFHSPKERRIYRGLVVACAVLMALSFAAPFLLSGGGGGYTDTRGGSGVSGGGQLAHILGNPLGYAWLLLKFLFTTYFTPRLFVENTIAFNAYMGDFPFGALSVPLLALAFLLERPGQGDSLRRIGPGVRLACVVSFFCAVCLAATAMYVAYTPVGADTINGCQWRYMMPVLLPMLLQLRPDRRWLPVSRDWLCYIVIPAQGLLLFAGLWPLMAAYV